MRWVRDWFAGASLGEIDQAISLTKQLEDIDKAINAAVGAKNSALVSLFSARWVEVNGQLELLKGNIKESDSLLKQAFDSIGLERLSKLTKEQVQEWIRLKVILNQLEKDMETAIGEEADC